MKSTCVLAYLVAVYIENVLPAKSLLLGGRLLCFAVQGTGAAAL